MPSCELRMRNKKQKIQNMKAGIYKTEFGWLGLASDGKKLMSIILPAKNRDIVKNQLKKIYKNNIIINDKDIFLRIAKEKIISFLERKTRNIDVPFKLVSNSKFYRKVWNITLTIPYGSIKSYKWIAGKLGDKNLARAVGRALGNNPLPLIVPCHRVINENGLLGGFSGGMLWKNKLLKMEKTWKI